MLIIHILGDSLSMLISFIKILIISIFYCKYIFWVNGHFPLTVVSVVEHLPPRQFLIIFQPYLIFKS